MKNAKYILVLTIITLFSQTGCANLINSNERASSMTVSIVTTKQINPNSKGKAAPVELKIFELKDDSIFASSFYDQLLLDPKKVLKNNYVDDYHYTLIPDHFKFIEPIALDPKTRYIGVIALFADSVHSNWKKIIKVNQNNKDYHLLVLLDKKDVSIKLVE